MDILEFEFELIDIAAVLIHIVASDEEGADDDDNGYETMIRNDKNIYMYLYQNHVSMQQHLKTMD